MALIPTLDRQNREVLCEFKAKLGLPEQASQGDSDTLSQNMKRKEIKSYLEGAASWNWTQTLRRTGQHSLPLGYKPSSPLCFLFQGRGAGSLTPSGLEFMIFCFRLLHNWVTKPSEDSSDTKFLSKIWSRQQVGVVSNIVETAINYVLTIHKNISHNINTNTRWELQANPVQISAPLPCVLTTGRVPNRAGHRSKLNTIF